MENYMNKTACCFLEHFLIAFALKQFHRILHNFFFLFSFFVCWDSKHKYVEKSLLFITIVAHVYFLRYKLKNYIFTDFLDVCCRLRNFEIVYYVLYKHFVNRSWEHDLVCYHESPSLYICMYIIDKQQCFIFTL